MALLLGCPVGLLGACADSGAMPTIAAPVSAAVESLLTGDAEFDVAPPPFTEGIFPCTDCHDPEFPIRADRRPMKTAHEEIVFDHDEENRWCLDCHSGADRDMLHLASGERLPFEESYRLCGQCHGDKLRDWRAGVHGRRSGYWNGEKHYQLCVNCHDAHSPRFAPIAPKPSPIPPRRTR